MDYCNNNPYKHILKITCIQPKISQPNHHENDDEYYFEIQHLASLVISSLAMKKL